MNWWMVAGLTLMPALAFMIGRGEGDAVGEARGRRTAAHMILLTALDDGHMFVDGHRIKVSVERLPAPDSDFWECVDCRDPDCSGRHL